MRGAAETDRRTKQRNEASETLHVSSHGGHHSVRRRTGMSASRSFAATGHCPSCWQTRTILRWVRTRHWCPSTRGRVVSCVARVCWEHHWCSAVAGAAAPHSEAAGNGPRKRRVRWWHSPWPLSVFAALPSGARGDLYRWCEWAAADAPRRTTPTLTTDAVYGPFADAKLNGWQAACVKRCKHSLPP